MTESLIRDVIVLHLSSLNLIRASQHGFMAGRSTVTNLLAYMETLLDDDQAVYVLYLDFAKAFDKVSQSLDRDVAGRQKTESDLEWCFLSLG